MKKLLVLLSLVIFSLTTQAQKKEWKEMHAFHAVMGKSFHPAEEGKLQPLKDNAASLVKRALEWQKSVVPQGYNKAITDPILKNLVAKCKEVKAAVKAKKDDATLTKLITEAHEIFHEIMEKCKKEDHKEN